METRSVRSLGYIGSYWSPRARVQPSRLAISAGHLHKRVDSRCKCGARKRVRALPCDPNAARHYCWSASKTGFVVRDAGEMWCNEDARANPWSAYMCVGRGSVHVGQPSLEEKAARR